MKRARVGGEEMDAFSRVARRWQQWRPGARKLVKRKANRRERRDTRVQLASEER